MIRLCACKAPFRISSAHIVTALVHVQAGARTRKTFCTLAKHYRWNTPLIYVRFFSVFILYNLFSIGVSSLEQMWQNVEVTAISVIGHDVENNSHVTIWRTKYSVAGGTVKTTYPLDKPVSGPSSKGRASKLRSQNANTALRSISSSCAWQNCQNLISLQNMVTACSTAFRELAGFHII